MIDSKHYFKKGVIMNNKNKNMSRRQAIKGIGAVALGTTALAVSSTAKANEKKLKKNWMEKQL